MRREKKICDECEIRREMVWCYDMVYGELLRILRTGRVDGCYSSGMMAFQKTKKTPMPNDSSTIAADMTTIPG